MQGMKTKEKNYNGYLQQTISMKGEWQWKTKSTLVHSKLFCLIYKWDS